MKEEKYKELIEDDVVGAILMFQQMSVPNRIKAVLYVLDNLDVNEKYCKMLLAGNFKELLKIIRVANKNSNGKDDVLIKEASEIYYNRYPASRPDEIVVEELTGEQPAERPTELEVEEINEEIEELEQEKVKNFYRLLA